MFSCFQLAWFPSGEVVLRFVVVPDDVFKVLFRPKTPHDEIKGGEGEDSKKDYKGPFQAPEDHEADESQGVPDENEHQLGEIG